MFIGERIIRTSCLKYGGSALLGDGSPGKPFDFDTDRDLWSIPAGMLITHAFLLVDTVIAGLTNLDIGDDDDPDGLIDSSLSVTLGTVGMYGYDAKLAGAYLRVSTVGATDAGDIYVVPSGKYYSAAGKEVKLASTTASTAGAARVVVAGVYLGLNDQN